MLSEKQCNETIQRYALYNPTYIWGMNFGQVDSFSAEKLFRLYGSSTGQYNQEYYNQKVQYALQNSQGYASDCSGFFYNIDGRGIDRTAQGYFNNCQSTGEISSIDTSHSCVVFRGTPSKISHIGYYGSDGYTYEMANSQDNFRKQKFNPKNWTYWGRPEFIDYSLTTPFSSSTLSLNPQKLYLYKGIDISTYQKNVDYKKVKESGVEFAILKIINKSLQPDSGFETHYLGCISQGIKVEGCYNYSYSTTIEQAREAANAVINVLNGRKLTVYLDVEDNVQKGLGSYLIDIINAYQEVIEQAGLTFGLYSGLSFYKAYIAPWSSNLKCKNKWIARYSKGYTEMPFSEDPNQDYKPMDGIMAWQYTSSGIVNGINGRVDLNVMYSLPVAPSNEIIIPTPINSITPITGLNPIIKNNVKTNGSKLNVRNKPSTDGSIVGKMNNGANVIIYGVDKTGQWARLSVPNSYWSSLSYISSTGVGIVTAEKSLYVRSSDSKSGEIWGVYKSNTKIKILHQSTNTGWYLTVGIGKDGKQIGGWCSDKYIRTS